MAFFRTSTSKRRLQNRRLRMEHLEPRYVLDGTSGTIDIAGAYLTTDEYGYLQVRIEGADESAVETKQPLACTVNARIRVVTIPPYQLRDHCLPFDAQ